MQAQEDETHIMTKTDRAIKQQYRIMMTLSFLR